MKTILCHRLPSQPVTIPPRIEVAPDSALVLPGRPLFIPDFAPGWIGQLYPAFRISRLGKNIGVRFASRYYDAVTIVLRLLPLQTRIELEAINGAMGLLCAFDNAIAIGQWQPVDAAQWDVVCGNLTFSVDPASFLIDDTIAQISRFSTLKMGDIVAPCHFPAQLPLSIDTTLNVDVSGTRLLDLRLK